MSVPEANLLIIDWALFTSSIFLLSTLWLIDFVSYLLRSISKTFSQLYTPWLCLNLTKRWSWLGLSALFAGKCSKIFSYRITNKECSYGSFFHSSIPFHFSCICIWKCVCVIILVFVFVFVTLSAFVAIFHTISVFLFELFLYL